MSHNTPTSTDSSRCFVDLPMREVEYELNANHYVGEPEAVTSTSIDMVDLGTPGRMPPTESHEPGWPIGATLAIPTPSKAIRPLTTTPSGRSSQAPKRNQPEKASTLRRDAPAFFPRSGRTSTKVSQRDRNNQEWPYIPYPAYRTNPWLQRDRIHQRWPFTQFPSYARTPLLQGDGKHPGLSHSPFLTPSKYPVLQTGRNYQEWPRPMFLSRGHRVTMIDPDRKVFVVDLLTPAICERIKILTNRHLSNPETSVAWREMFKYTSLDMPCCDVPPVMEIAEHITSDMRAIVGNVYNSPNRATKLRERRKTDPHLLLYQKVPGRR